MRKIFTILFTITLLTACSNQETIKATGEGDLWKANVTYEVTDSELYDRGGIECIGDEELLYVTYSLVLTKVEVLEKGNLKKIKPLYRLEQV